MPIFGSSSHPFPIFIYSGKTVQHEGDPVSIIHISGHGQPIKDNIFNLNYNEVHDVEGLASHDVKHKPLLKTSDRLCIANPG
jgi:hypothetical protein